MTRFTRSTSTTSRSAVLRRRAEAAMAEGREVCVQPSLLLILLDSLDETVLPADADRR